MINYGLILIKQKNEDDRIRLNLTVEKEFYPVITKKAEENYLKVPAFIIHQLKMALMTQPIKSIVTDADSDNSDERTREVKAHRKEFGEKFIVFPNAMYGNWVNALQNEKDEVDYQTLLKEMAGSDPWCD